MEPGTPETRIAALADLANVLGMPDALRSGDKQRIASFWKAYHDDLEHLPDAVLRRACVTYRRSGERWFPTPGQLREIARRDEQWREDAAVLAGLKKLADAKPEHDGSYVPSSEWVAIWSWLDDLVTGIHGREEAERKERKEQARVKADPARWDQAGAEALRRTVGKWTQSKSGETAVAGPEHSTPNCRHGTA